MFALEMKPSVVGKGSDFGLKGIFFRMVSKGISSDELYAEVQRGTVRRGSFFASLPVHTHGFFPY
jgi:hypothetical protein